MLVTRVRVWFSNLIGFDGALALLRSADIFRLDGFRLPGSLANQTMNPSWGR